MSARLLVGGALALFSAWASLQLAAAQQPPAVSAPASSPSPFGAEDAANGLQSLVVTMMLALMGYKHVRPESGGAKLDQQPEDLRSTLALLGRLDERSRRTLEEMRRVRDGIDHHGDVLQSMVYIAKKVDSDWEMPAPRRHEHREAPAQRVRHQRREHQDIEGVQRRYPEHAVRDEVGLRNRQHQGERHGADAEVEQDRRGEDERQRDIERPGLAEGNRHAARRAEGHQAHGSEDPDITRARAFAAG
jgi:hypothetical protein